MKSKYYYIHVLPIVNGSMDEEGEGYAIYVEIPEVHIGDEYYDIINYVGANNSYFNNDIKDCIYDVDEIIEITYDEFHLKYLK